MSADPFMLDLFVSEARRHCAVLEAVRAGGGAAADGARAANSLKGAARLLGFSKFADVCAKIDDFLHRVEGRTKFNSSLSFAVETLVRVSKADALGVERAVAESEREFDEILKSDFRAEEVDSDSAVQSPSADGLPAIDASMKPLFLEEVGNQLAKLSSGLVELEDDFSNAQKLESLMRASHSLKGAARVVGLDDIVAFTHEMENCFVSAQNARIALGSDSLDVFLECVDFLSALRDGGFESVDRSRLRELLEKLKALENGVKIPATSADKTPAKPRETTRAASPRRGDSFVRVSAESLDSLMELAAESLVENRRIELYRESMATIKEAQERIARQLERATNSLEGAQGSDAAVARLEQLRRSMRRTIDSTRAQIDSLGEFSRRNVVLSDRLYAEVLASRMRPFSDGVSIFPRMVRDIAKEAGKKISLEIRGKDVPVDRDVLEKLEAPLTHLLRNACDHGVEFPDEREAKGKPRAGRITLGAWHSAGFLMLEVRDDGRGLDERKIRANILARKLVAPDLLENMPSDEVFEFLFLPGFTTKESVSQMSGRGVGLDVVQSMLREVGGSISVSTRAGRGAAFTMKLPITRSVIKALMVEIGGEPYAFALGRISRTLKFSPSEVILRDGAGYVKCGTSEIPLLSCADVLGLKTKRRRSSSELYAVVCSGRKRAFAFEVDSLPSESELVVRPLHASLGKIPCVSAASLDEQGLPVLVIDVDDLLNYAGKCSACGATRVASEQKESAQSAKRILVVDDSATVRETQRKILASAGYAVDTAVDGVDGWNSFRISKPDLVVSDIDMPRMTGFEMVAKIRSVDSKTPIIIVSYKDRSEDRTKGLRAGANAFLAKSSFHDDSFLKAVREYI